MNNAISIYEDLADRFLYTAKSWLHLDLAEATINEGKEICAATAFLFDNLFLKENAGGSISKQIASELGVLYRPERLSNLATKMRLAMAGEDFSLGSSPLRDYIKWVADAAPTVKHAFLDDYGKLALMYAEELTNLFLRENDAQHAPLHVAEIVFLTSTDLFGNFYLRTFGAQEFRSFRSYPYFESVMEEMKRIRAEIVD